MAPTITSSKDLVAHYNGYLSIIGKASTTATDLGPYFAPTLEVDGKTITVEEFRAIVPPDTVTTAELFVADIEARTLAVRVKIHVPAMNLKMTEHVFYGLDEQWRINKCTRLYSIEGNEVPIGN
ncbi:hypothetical protein R3P38DRAFT_2680487 [Favolaschia claudopus]|uniref:Nuclear transport factor 2 family protein n=1 Tax=Favolaschia claudopus TaxID=2862362 RepID=A0AAW0E074_9AGAR